MTHKRRSFLCAVSLSAALLLMTCVRVKETVTGIEDSPGSPPPTPEIAQVVPIVGEPRRGMHVVLGSYSQPADGFTLQRQGPGESFADVAVLSPASRHYDDWGLSLGTTYSYRIRAFNTFGASPWSTIRTATSAGPETASLLTYATADTYVDESKPNSNYGSLRYLQIAGSAGHWGGRSSGLILFSLPTLPQHAHGISSAHLRLCEAGGGNTAYPGPVRIYAVPIIGDWSESLVTWNNRPGTWLSNYALQLHDPNQASCVTIAVSQIVIDWYSGVRSNRGFMLFSDSNAYAAYYSREGYVTGSALLRVDYVW